MPRKTINFTEMVGPSYQSQSKYAAIERCVNFFVEVIEVPGETKNKVSLYPTPCTAVYGTLPGVNLKFPARGLLELNGNLFGINGSVVYQFFPPGPLNPVGTFIPVAGPGVYNDGLPVSMIANGVIVPGQQQILISSGDKGYILTPSAAGNTLTPLNAAVGFLGGRGAAFLDDYFISIIPGTNGIQVSPVNNGLGNWDPTAVAYTQGQSDALVNLIADRELLWLFGSRRSEIWYNSGASGFPFAIQPGAFIECGLEAAASLVQADNTLFWLGQDKRGGNSIWRANGINPVRVSTHAVELAISRYSSVSDCVAYSFLWRGHTFIRFIFPTATIPGNPQVGYAWTYDCAASGLLGIPVWHENNFTDLNGNTFAPLERTHAYFQGTHVVGSGGVEGNAGTLYSFTDYTTLPKNPYLTLQLSNDGGNTWDKEIQIFVGAAGQYQQRALANLLGNARDRVFKVKCVDMGEAGGGFPIVRERICPHIWENNNRVTYHRLELELNKAIGQEGGATDGFWGIITAELTMTPGAS